MYFKFRLVRHRLTMRAPDLTKKLGMGGPCIPEDKMTATTTQRLAPVPRSDLAKRASDRSTSRQDCSTRSSRTLLRLPSRAMRLLSGQLIVDRFRRMVKAKGSLILQISREDSSLWKTTPLQSYNGSSCIAVYKNVCLEMVWEHRRVFRTAIEMSSRPVVHNLRHEVKKRMHRGSIGVKLHRRPGARTITNELT